MEDCLVFQTGAGLHRYCVVLMALGEKMFSKSTEEVKLYMSSTARKALEMAPATYVMVVAVHVDLVALPYSKFCLIHKDGWAGT